jgi:hypothetical protein
MSSLALRDEADASLDPSLLSRSANAMRPAALAKR